VTTQTDFINSIPDAKPVRIFLPLQGEDKRQRQQCILQKTTAPRFNLLFVPGSLPVGDLDTKTTCIINLDIAGRIVSLEAMIEQVAGEQVLKMIAHKTISHEQMRDYFRVDLTLPILARSQVPEDTEAIEGSEGREKYWQLSGNTIDISGCGLLAIFHHQPPADKIVKLRLILPDDHSSTLSFLARTVRTTEVEKNRYVVAYHYEDINDEDRDRIVGQCLLVQRRMLRLNVMVKDL
jgi:hypothetical protein